MCEVQLCCHVKPKVHVLRVQNAEILVFKHESYQNAIELNTCRQG